MKIVNIYCTQEFSFIKHRLSEVINQDNSNSMVKGAGVRYGVPWSKLWYVFLAPFYPTLTALLDYPNPAILHLFGFCFIAS